MVEDGEQGEVVVGMGAGMRDNLFAGYCKRMGMERDCRVEKKVTPSHRPSGFLAVQ
jgi:hypothetical protein